MGGAGEDKRELKRGGREKERGGDDAEETAALQGRGWHQRRSVAGGRPTVA